MTFRMSVTNKPFMLNIIMLRVVMMNVVVPKHKFLKNIYNAKLKNSAKPLTMPMYKFCQIVTYT